jgi:hypothetical protein
MSIPNHRRQEPPRRAAHPRPLGSSSDQVRGPRASEDNPRVILGSSPRTEGKAGDNPRVILGSSPRTEGKAEGKGGVMRVPPEDPGEITTSKKEG